MFCAKCGKEIPEGAVFCPKCGSPQKTQTGGIKLPDTYEMHEKIGKGGGGTVFRAYHKNLRKEVVIKKNHDTITDERMQRVEADILKNLHHQYLPQVFDYFVIDGVGYTVMDYVEGESLQQMLDRGVKLSEKKVLKYARQLTEALDYLHSRKIPVIHGDIKPDNIMRTSEDNICLIDFNISGISLKGKAHTFGYSPGYSAPEQFTAFQKIRSQMMQSEQENCSADPEGDDETELLNDDRNAGNKKNAKRGIELTEGIPVDQRSDIYSVGATLYRLYCGRVYDPTKDTVLKGNVSEGFVYILNRCLQTDPAKRFQNAAALKKVLFNLHKKNRSYRRLVFWQSVLQLLFLVLIVAGAGLIMTGRTTLEKEKQEKYSGYIEELKNKRLGEDLGSFDLVYEKAVAFYPDRLEAYYQKALYLYDRHQYEEDIRFIERYIVVNGEFYKQDEIADIYFILGNCYFEIEDYEMAANHLGTAIRYNETNPEYYVDRAIALARDGEIASAEKALLLAQERNALDDMVYLAGGEILYAKGDYISAEEELRKCISCSADDYVKLRAYIRCSQSIDGQRPVVDITEKDENGLQKVRETAERSIQLLNEAMNELPLEYQMMVLQQMASEYIYAYDYLAEEDYAAAALEILKRVDAMGWGDYTVYDNMVNLYHRVGNLADEAALLDWMDSEYQGNYRIRVKQAMLEYELQRQKEQGNRDYTLFKQLYEEALQLYENTESKERTEQEIVILNQAYQELIKNHWISD